MAAGRNPGVPKPTARPRGVPKTDVASANPRRCAWAQGRSSGSPLLWDRTHRARGSLPRGTRRTPLQRWWLAAFTPRHTEHTRCLPVTDNKGRVGYFGFPKGRNSMPHRAHSRLPVVDPSEHGSASGEMRPQPRLPMWGQGEPSPAGADVAASACTRWGTWQTLDITLSVLRSAPLRVSTYSADAGGAIGENSSA